MKVHSLIVLIATAAIALSPIAVAASDTSYPSQVEPGSAANVIDPLSLLAYSSNIMTLISQGGFSNATALLQEYNMTSLPSDLRPIFDAYISQAGSLNANVQDIESLVNETESYLSAQDASGANQTIGQAGISIGQAQILISEIGSTTTSMGDQLGVSGQPRGSPNALMYSNLQGSTQNVSDLVNYYLNVLLTYQQQALALEGQTGTVPTSLTLSSNVTQAWIGDYIQLSGTLSSNGSAMPDKNVTILMDGGIFANATTGPDGAFALALQIPPVYEDTAVFLALYAPSGNDTAVYVPSASTPLAIQVLFHRAGLTFNSPAVAYPGSQVAVGGNVTFDGSPSAGTAVQIYLDGSFIASVESGPGGSFALNFTLGQQVSTGAHQITASVLPSGIYSGINETNLLEITKIPVSVSVSLPSIAFMPGALGISGKVTSLSIPLNATVSITMANSSKAVVTKNGLYSSNLDLPFGLWLIGFQKVSVSVTPADPWYAAAQTKGEVFVVNPVLVASSVAAVAVAVFSFSRFRRSSASGSGPVAAVIEQAPSASGSSGDSSGGSSDLSSLPIAKGLPFSIREVAVGRRRIIESYVRAARFIEARTGIRMEVDMTINELKVRRPILPA